MEKIESDELNEHVGEGHEYNGELSFQNIHEGRDISQTLFNKQNYLKFFSIALIVVVIGWIYFIPKTISHDFSKEHIGHKEQIFDYPTLGVPIPGNKFDFRLIQDKDWYAIEQQMTSLLFKPYNDTNCEMKRFGNKNDDGYLVCQNFAKDADALINFGIEARDNFGCAFTSEHKILNLQYDCTNLNAPKCDTNENNNRFFDICMGDRTEEFQYKFTSLKDIIDNNNLKGKRTIIKIDIEGGQWVGFRTLPMSYLQFIDQIIMEVHFFKSYAFFGNLQIIRSLSKHFVNTQLHLNNVACYGWDTSHYLNAHAIEITLVNKRLIKINKQTRSFTPHPLSEISFPHVRYDCQMRD